VLQGKEYVPLLKTGVAEIGAYRSLFPDVRDLTFPIFNMRPWPNASHFQFTLSKTIEASAGFPFGLALDVDRRGRSSNLAAQQEFDALFVPDGGYSAYYNLVESVPEAVPVLIDASCPLVMGQQLANAAALDRGLIIYQGRGLPGSIWNMISQIGEMPHDTVVVIDAGWSRDYLSQEAWILPIAEQIIGALPTAEFVVMSSSFPDSFSHIVGHSEENATERRLFWVVRQRFQQADITYGDWGSTRVSTGGGGGGIPSRVDVPSIGSWHIFRADPKNDLGFCEMAWDAQHHPCFSVLPDSWGKEMIQITDDEGSGITSRPTATQVRINLHMTIQSGAASVPPTDEIPYED